MLYWSFVVIIVLLLVDNFDNCIMKKYIAGIDTDYIIVV